MICHSLSCFSDSTCPFGDVTTFGDSVLYSMFPQHYTIGELKVTFYEYNTVTAGYRRIYHFGLYGGY